MDLIAVVPQEILTFISLNKSREGLNGRSETFYKQQFAEDVA